MFGIHRLNIDWTDDNHCHVQDPDNGRGFDVTVQPKSNTFVGGHPVKPRLYINNDVTVLSRTENRRKQINWAREYYGHTLKKILNKDVEIKFSGKAGCSCGCSPGFIIQDASFPFDIWMKATA